jgi:cobalt-zinc-cadmium efflux system outer membrane protein
MSRILATAAVACVFGLSARSVSANPITLPEALAMVERSPSLRLAAASVGEAEGRLEQATLYNYNPALSAQGGAWYASNPVLYDFQISLGQRFELGGKRGARKRVASAERDAAVELVSSTRIELHAEVRRAYNAALVAQERVAVTLENETWARQFQDAARERMRLGAATQTEVNVAVAGLGRAIAANKEATRDVLIARQALERALGLPGADLEPTGALPTFPAAPANEADVVAIALASRRDLAAMDRIRVARDASVTLADAQATPDPELSVSWARSQLEDNTGVLVGVSVDLPLWNRNQGGRAAARASKTRAEVELAAMRATVERDVRIALRRYRAAISAVEAFDKQVVGTLAENLELARQTLAAGKLGLLDINNVRRDLVESQLTYLNAVLEAVAARAELETSMGRSLEGDR